VGRWTNVDSKGQEGFTLVELLVGILLMSIVSIGFYSVLFASSRASDTSRAVTKISEEARLGFSRMVRDTRQGRGLVAATSTSYTVEVDFDGDGAIAVEGTTNSQDDYEVLTFSFNKVANTVSLNGEILMRRVQCIDDSDPCEAFTYTSNRLEYDWNRDGITEWDELDAAPSKGVIGVGNGNGVLDSKEIPFISNVTYELKVVEKDSSTDYIAEAQLRNLR
jgi:prepilin-type N-terminal cleavage/methylation domain-containing protein